MKHFKVLIFISVLALFFTQCTVKPSKRTYNNAVGLWVGTGYDDNLDNWTLGVDLKHLNSKSAIKDLISGVNINNTGWNLYSGFHFGKRYGMNIEASYRILTDDLVLRSNGNTGQYYIGPSLGFDYYISNGGKSHKFSPNLGASLGALLLFPAYKNYPESDISFEGSMNMINYMKDKTIKEEGIGRILYHIYFF
jgi:hypothetical protein